MEKNKILRKSLCGVLLLLIGLNTIAFFHAYKFTHFSSETTIKTGSSKKLSILDKTKALVFGVVNPRPINKERPTKIYETIRIKANLEIECWNLKVKDSKGTVVLFHGYGGEKSSLLDKSDVFLELGYNTLLVDFMGSGGSDGMQTTIGFKEAEQVEATFQYLKSMKEKNIYLFGTSMGAVAILRAIDTYELKPEGVILECPFGSMYKTVCTRFKTMNVPTFPMAGLLVFWGGIQNGFWAFGHNPIEYAKSVSSPVLLMYGEKDEKVGRQEINEILHNLKGQKDLKLYPEAGHENYLIKYKKQWSSDVAKFLEKH